MDLLFIFLLMFVLYSLQRQKWVFQVKKADSKVNPKFIDFLFAMHMVMWLVYLLYAYATRSDAFQYYQRSLDATNWTALFGTGTTFIEYLAYPFSNTLGLSFNSVMLIFSFLGFQGLVHFYFAARENLKNLPIKWQGLTYLELLFLLPNCHFWSSSLGKGSVIMFGIGLTVFGLSRIRYRKIYAITGAILVYMVRPHILFALLVGLALGLLFSRKGINWVYKIPLLIASFIVMFLLSDDVIEFTGTESLNVFESNAIDHRASELAKSSSGVDISNYNQAMKLFTLLFRPLFIDAPGILGFITSFENLLLLFMAFQMLKRFRYNWRKGDLNYMTSLFIFMLISIALAQVTGNLGIAMRQKAQVIPFFFVAFCYTESWKRKTISLKRVSKKILREPRIFISPRFRKSIQDAG